MPGGYKAGIPIKLQPIIDQVKNLNALNGVKLSVRDIVNSINSMSTKFAKNMGIEFNDTAKSAKTLARYLAEAGISLRENNGLITLFSRNMQGMTGSVSGKITPMGKYEEMASSHSVSRQDEIQRLTTAWREYTQARKELWELEASGVGTQNQAKYVKDTYDNLQRLRKELVQTNSAENDYINILDRKLSYGAQNQESIHNAQIAQKEQNAQVREYVSLRRQELAAMTELERLKAQLKGTDAVNGKNQAAVKAQENVVSAIRNRINALEGLGVQDKLTTQQQAELNIETAKHEAALRKGDIQLKKSTSLLGNFRSMLTTVVQSGISWRLFSYATQSIEKTVDTVRELDKSITNLSIATGKSRDSARELLTTYNQMAKELGTTTADVADSAVTWLRQGYAIDETNELIRTSNILAKVGNIDAASATQYLTSAVKGYKVEVQDAIGIVDMLTAIDLKAATSSGDLAEAMSKTANMARLTGVEMNQLLGIIAATAEVTQADAGSVGTAMKTIFSRMSNVKAGKDVDEEGESLNDVEKVLKRTGIALRKNNGEWRDFYEVLDEIASKWSDIKDTQQSQIRTALAGTRQGEMVTTLMENWDKVKEYALAAANAEGTAEKKFKAYQESVEASQKRLTATFEEFAQKILNSDSIGNFYDTLTDMLKFLTDNIWILKTLIVGLGDYVLYKILTKVISKTKSLSSQFDKFNAQFRTAKKEGKSTLEALNTGLTGTQLKLAVISTIITAITVAITLWKQKQAEVSRAIEQDADKAQEEAQKLKEQNTQLDELIEKYKSLNNSGRAQSEIKDDLINLQREINSLTTEEANNINIINGNYADQLKALAKIRAEKQKEVSEAENTSVSKYGAVLSDKGLNNIGETVFESATEGLTKTLSLGLLPGASFSESAIGLSSTLSKEVQSRLENAGARKLSTGGLQYRYYFGGTADQIAEQYNILLEEQKKIVENYTNDSIGLAQDSEYKAVTAAIDYIGDSVKAYNSAKEEALKSAQQQSFWAKLTELSNEDYKALESGSRETMEAIVKDMAKNEEATKAFYSLFEEWFPKLRNTSIDTTAQIADTFNTLKGTLESLTSAYSSLNKAVSEYNDQGYISIDTYKDILENYSEYVGLIVDANGDIVENTQALRENIATNIRKMAITSAQSLLDKVQMMNSADILAMLKEHTVAVEADITEQWKLIAVQIQALNISKEAKEALWQQAKAFAALAEKTVAGIGATSSSTSAQDKYNKTLDYAQKVIQKQIDALQKQKEAIEEANEELQKEIDNYDKVIAYINKNIDVRIDAIEKEKDALRKKNEEKEKEIELEELQNNLRKAQQRTMRVYHEGKGWQWETNPSAIQEAQTALDNRALEDQILILDEKISQLQEYQDAVGEVTEVYEDELDKQAFEQNQNYITQKGLDNLVLAEVEKFKNAYVDKQRQINANTTEEFDAQIKKLNDLKDSWANLKDEAELSQLALTAQQVLGANAETTILTNRLENLADFTEQYKRYCAEQIAVTHSVVAAISDEWKSFNFTDGTLGSPLNFSSLYNEAMSKAINTYTADKNTTLSPAALRHLYLTDKNAAMEYSGSKTTTVNINGINIRAADGTDAATKFVDEISKYGIYVVPVN